MNHYRLYFRALETKVAQLRVELIEAETDSSAREKAQCFVGQHILELWLQGRKICTIDDRGRESGKALSALYACIADGRSPSATEMESVISRTLNEAFSGDSTASTRNRAITLTRAAFHGARRAA
jgi:hypothetical protein